MKKSWVCYKQIFAAFALFAAKVVPSFFLATRYSLLVPRTCQLRSLDEAKWNPGCSFPRLLHKPVFSQRRRERGV